MLQPRDQLDIATKSSNTRSGTRPSRAIGQALRRNALTDQAGPRRDDDAGGQQIDGKCRSAFDAYLPCTIEQREKSLAVARRLFAEQEARVRQQEELIARLRATGQPTDVAKETLVSMNRTLMIILQEIARLGGVGPDSPD